MNISSSGSSFTAGAYASKGFSGLASGLDTDSMVEQMLAGTQAKIDKQKGARQQLVWKQEIYRSIITKLNNFRSKYTGTSYAASALRSAAFFNSMKASALSDAVRVTAGSSASVGRTTVDVARLASAATATSDPASAALEGQFDADAFERRLVLTDADGNTVADVDLAGAASAQDIANKINAAYTGGGIASIDDNGRLLLNAGSGTLRVSGESSALGLSMTGLSVGAKTVEGVPDPDAPEAKANIMRSAVDPDAKASITVELNGVSKTIELDDVTSTPAASAASALADQLNEKIHQSLGDGLTVTADGTKLKFETKEGQWASISGSSSALKALGVKNGASTRINTSLKLKDIGFGTGLQGSRFAFKINGTEITATAEDTLASVMAKINNSDAGVKVSYDTLTDKFTMTSKNSGAGAGIDIEQTEGNLLSAMFGNGIAAGSSATTGPLTSGSITSLAGDFDALEGLTSGKFQITVNGEAISINLPAKADNATDTKDEALGLINQALADKFGAGKLSLVSDASGDRLEIGDTNLLVEFEAEPDPASLVAKLDFGGKNNYMTQDEAAATFGVDGTNVLYDATTGMLTVKSGATINSDIQGAFGGSLTLGNGQAGADFVQAGQNALVCINGTWTERSSNSFTVSGLTMTLQETTGTYDPTAATPDAGFTADPDKTVKIDVERNTDEVFETIKSFVDDYNDMIDELNGYVDSKATYRDYAPLTDAQKKEMSEKEILAWEEKAKTGLLRQDSSVSSFLQEMRTALYSKPEGSALGLYDIGIETSDEWRDKGKLVLDESKLRSMLETNGDDIAKLFTDSEGGLGVRIDAALSRAANTSSASPGTLVQMAGVENKASDSNNSLYFKMKSIDERLEVLKRQYQAEKTRYWNQFNAMEKYISQMNSQSSWIAQQFS